MKITVYNWLVSTKVVSPENTIHVTLYRLNRYGYVNGYTHTTPPPPTTTTVSEKEATDLKERKDWCLGGLGGKKEKGIMW